MREAVNGRGALDAIGAWMSRLGPRGQRSLRIRTAGANVAKARSACMLASFVATLRGRSEPVVIDLGPASGGNVEFLGEYLACKLFVEDMLEKLPKPQGDAAGAPPPLRYADGSADGILCWDVFDYLSPAAGRVLAADLVRVLRPTGALLLYHRTEGLSDPRRVSYEIIDENHLRCRFCDDTVPRSSRVIESREVVQMFPSLSIAGAIRLKSQMREVLFRKPSPAANAG